MPVIAALAVDNYMTNPITGNRKYSKRKHSSLFGKTLAVSWTVKLIQNVHLNFLQCLHVIAAQAKDEIALKSRSYFASCTNVCSYTFSTGLGDNFWHLF